MTRTKAPAATRIRHGFTLVELTVAVVIFAIIGAALTRLLTSQGRFYDKMSMMHAARNVSRGSLNRVVSDIRMIEATGGVVSASATQITARIPYVIGALCDTKNGWTQVSMLPVDSVMYSAPGFYGYAWRDPNTGAYVYAEPAQVDTAQRSICDNVKISTIAPLGGVALVAKLFPTLPVGATLGTPVFLYRKIRYEFKASTAVPGAVGLYRTTIFTNGTESTEEIVAPFAATAGFKFFVVGNSTTAQAAAPVPLSNTRGIELHLDGISEAKVSGSATNEAAPFTTAVFFKNRLN